MLVCNGRKGMVDDPKLWTWSVLPVIPDWISQEIRRFTGWSLLKNILKLSQPGSDNGIRISLGIWLIFASPGQSSIRCLWHWDLWFLGPWSHLCRRALKQAGCAETSSAIFTPQYEHIFTAIAQKEKVLWSSFSSWFHSDEISPALFASAVSNAKELKLAALGTRCWLCFRNCRKWKTITANLYMWVVAAWTILNPDIGWQGSQQVRSSDFLQQVAVYEWVSHESWNSAIFSGVTRYEASWKIDAKGYFTSYARGLDEEELLRKTAKKIDNLDEG